MKEIRSMKTEPQNAAPAHPQTEDSHVDAETHDQPDTRKAQDLPTNTGGERSGWRAYFPAAVRKTLKRRNNENQARESFEKLTARFAKTLVVLFFAFICFAATARANTYIVSTTTDNGNNSSPTFGSLRKAIRDANAVPGADTIIFQIPGSGVHTITPPVELPEITDTLTIDGYTQSGASSNTQQTGSNAILTIELNGASAGGFATGLLIKAPDCFIRGLVINRFNNAILFQHDGGQNGVVSGCFIGTNAAGTVALPNIIGIYFGDSPGNLIGGCLSFVPEPDLGSQRSERRRNQNRRG
jgi:hypothetical protein